MSRESKTPIWKYFLASAGVFASLNGGSAAKADTAALEAQIQAMQRAISDLQRQVNEAKAQAAAASKQASAAKPAEDIDLKVRWRGAPEFSSADGNFKFKVRGRIHADANFADQDEAVTGRPDINATTIRRARLGVQGTVFEDIDYILEADFANNSVSLADAYLEYTGWPVGIRLGHFKTFNSLEETTSSNYITFLERAAFINAFGLGVRRIGVGAIYDKNKHFTLSAGYFGGNAGEQAPQESDAFGARATFAPINNEQQTLHLGGSVRTRNAGITSSTNFNTALFGYSARGADLALTDSFINTGAIGNSDTFWALELAGVWGPFSVQSEYGQLDVDTPSAIGGSPTYKGWYVDGSWFLTGERRPYSNGVFGRVKVKNPVFKGGKGAWQLAGRWDVLDLSDSSFGCPVSVNFFPSGNQFLCGKQSTWLVGVNWYLNDYTRLMLNYNESEIEGGFNDGAKIKGLGLRAQVDW
jgi:phosphate-selective porin OprO and OprP